MTNGRSSAANVAPAAAPAVTSNASRLLRISLPLWCSLCKLPVAAHSCCTRARPIRAISRSLFSCSASLYAFPCGRGFAQLAACKALASSCVRVGQQFCALLYPSANGSPQQESLRPVHTAEASRSRGVNAHATWHLQLTAAAITRETERRAPESTLWHPQQAATHAYVNELLNHAHAHPHPRRPLDARRARSISSPPVAAEAPQAPRADATPLAQSERRPRAALGGRRRHGARY